MDYAISRHARRRLRQRGYRESDLALIVEHGTPTREGFVLTRRDVAARVAELKREIACLERLEGSFVATVEDTVKSVFRPRKRQRRNILH